jgi:uncharacterized protein (TIGR02246 family)
MDTAWQAQLAQLYRDESRRVLATLIRLLGDFDLAVVHYLFHCGVSDDKGEMHSNWMRVSQCFRQQDGRWLIAHEHFSMPGDMESGKILFDLQP